MKLPSTLRASGLRNTKIPLVPWRNNQLRSHGSHAHSHAPTDILSAVKSLNDPGSRITIIGFASNIGLVCVKAISGFAFNSASLLAEAGHSLTDTVSDVVTLATWKVSQRKPSHSYPLGFAKIQTFGSFGISATILGASIGIGLQSTHLLLDALTISQVAGGQWLSSTLGTASEFFSHSHTGGDHHHAIETASTSHKVLNPAAAGVAAASVGVKEWLYRKTKKVAEDQSSPLLAASAYHHRSDAYTSGAALLAILGTWAGAPLLDPIGGLAIAGLLGYQGSRMMVSSLKNLADASVPDSDLLEIQKMIQEIMPIEGLQAIVNVTATRPAGKERLELTMRVAGKATVLDLLSAQSALRTKIVENRSSVESVHMSVVSNESPAQLKDTSSQC